MDKNIQSTSKQNLNSVQYIHIYAETVLSMNLRRNSRGKLHASQGGLPGSSLLRLDGSCGSQAGRLSHMSHGHKTLNLESENGSRQPMDLLKDRHSDRLNKSQLTLSQGMLKRGDDANNEVDDIVEPLCCHRTVRQQH
jgi:hypothetical protein